MANLGYWQMKVSPGVWYLQLAPGRSSELYTLKEDGDGSQGKQSSKLITIDDLRGKVVHMEVVKKKGKEHEKLLVPDDDDNLQDEKVSSVKKNVFWKTMFLMPGKEKGLSYEKAIAYLHNFLYMRFCREVAGIPTF